MTTPPQHSTKNVSKEINFRAAKRLLPYSQNPNKNFKFAQFRGIDFYSSKYDNYIILGDFNTKFSNILIEQYFGSRNIKYLIKKPQCFKNVAKPFCIDLI